MAREHHPEPQGDGTSRGRAHHFPMKVRSVGDRVTWSQLSRLPRPWEARSGEVYALERHVTLDPQGEITRRDEASAFWRKGGQGFSEGPVDGFELCDSTRVEMTSTLMMLVLDPLHEETTGLLLRGYHDRLNAIGAPRSRGYSCLSFWGGMLLMEDSRYLEHVACDDLVPSGPAGAGFAVLWREVPFARSEDARMDAEILLGKYVSDRLYPGLREPRPSSRYFGLNVGLEDYFPGPF